MALQLWIAVESPAPSNSHLPREYSIYPYLHAIEDCIAGIRFNRLVFRWADSERLEFKEWCECRGIPLPKALFLFGWKGRGVRRSVLATLRVAAVRARGE